MKTIILRKRLAGVLCILVIHTFFIASTPNDCIYITVSKIDASLLKKAMFESSGIDDITVKNIAKPPIKEFTEVNAPVDLEKRYDKLGYKSENVYIRSVINDFMPTIKKYCEIYDIPASVIMALFINEFVVSSEKRLTELASAHHNYGSLKKKNDGYLSEAIVDILNKTTNGVVYFKDDDVDKKTGKIMPSAFYKFKSRQAGIYACISFIYDRAMSDHPNYKGKFSGLGKDDVYEWAYALYDAGYANKKGYPLDKKIIRIIRTYDL